MRNDIRNLAIGLLIGVGGFYVFAAVSVPNTFSAGTIISADEMNANFSAVTKGINTLETNMNTGINTLTSSVNNKQARVTGTCKDGASIQEIKADGTVICALNVISGDATEIAALKSDLQTLKDKIDVLNATVTNLNTVMAAVQIRVTGTCEVGQAIREIRADGGVICGTQFISFVHTIVKGGNVESTRTSIIDNLFTNGNPDIKIFITPLAIYPVLSSVISVASAIYLPQEKKWAIFFSGFWTNDPLFYNVLAIKQ
jgi:hypothetical protein